MKCDLQILIKFRDYTSIVIFILFKIFEYQIFKHQTEEKII